MPNVVVAGAQWGDEGKGKIVDLLAGKVQVVARYNGGHNAGHTVHVGGRRYVMHLVPTGVLRSGVLCVLGNGTVIDPWALEAELAELRAQDVAVDENLLISDRAHLILPHHRVLEELAEARRGAGRIGTTGRGIGPAYEDKAGRRGLRTGDLLRPGSLPEKLAFAREHFEAVCRGAGRAPELDWGALALELTGLGERLAARVTDVSAVLHREMARGYSVLFEGAQATLLDLDHGSYPYVTSSAAAAGGVAAGLGIPPQRIDGALGIAKAYATRVGSGPFPTQIGGSLEEELRKRGNEFGATTGRPRRCGWFDAVVARYAARVNGFDALAITKLDVLDPFPQIPVCVSYRHEGERLDQVPSDPLVFAACEPIYETLPGWAAQTAGVRSLGALPKAARRYLDRLAELSGCEIGIVSTGADREDTIVCDRSAIASWFG